jgi:hypothetical protein
MKSTLNPRHANPIHNPLLLRFAKLSDDPFHAIQVLIPPGIPIFCINFFLYFLGWGFFSRGNEQADPIEYNRGLVGARKLKLFAVAFT